MTAIRTWLRSKAPALKLPIQVWLCIAGVALSGFATGETQPLQLSRHYPNGTQFMGLRVLASLLIEPATVNGLPLRELSGLAWDADAGLLYALSDQGAIFHLRPVFAQGILRDIAVLGGFPLKNEHGVRLTRHQRDAEGLSIRNANNGRPDDAELVISFESTPRIARYRPDGTYLGQIDIPARFTDPSHYQSNRALEAVTELPELGVISGSERPMLNGESSGGGLTESPEEGSAETTTLFSTSGRTWRYPLYPVPNSALVAAEALADGSLLTVERGHGIMYLPITIILRRTEPLRSASETLAVSTIAVLNSAQGWSLDNFEGLAHHQGRRFFLISDDNMQRLQRTILVYLELEPGALTGEHFAVPDYELDQTSRN